MTLTFDDAEIDRIANRQRQQKHRAKVALIKRGKLELCAPYRVQHNRTGLTYVVTGKYDPSGFLYATLHYSSACGKQRRRSFVLSPSLVKEV